MQEVEVRSHPIVACADAIEQALKDVVGVDPAFLSLEDKAETLRRLTPVADRGVALRLSVMASAGEVAESTADHSVATGVASETPARPRMPSGDLALAREPD